MLVPDSIITSNNQGVNIYMYSWAGAPNSGVGEGVATPLNFGSGGGL